MIRGGKATQCLDHVGLRGRAAAKKHSTRRLVEVKKAQSRGWVLRWAEESPTWLDVRVMKTAQYCSSTANHSTAVLTTFGTHPKHGHFCAGGKMFWCPFLIHPPPCWRCLMALASAGAV